MVTAGCPATLSVLTGAVEADESSQVHPGVLAALQRSGLNKLMVPAQYGGRAERLDPLAICLVREVLMATSRAPRSIARKRAHRAAGRGTPGSSSKFMPGGLAGGRHDSRPLRQL